MKRSKKVLIIAACLFLIVLVGSSIYVYERIATLLSAADLQQLLGGSNQDKLSTFSSPQAPQSSQNAANNEGNTEQQTSTGAADTEQIAPSQSNKQASNQQLKPSAPSKSPALDNKIVNKLEKEAGRPVDTGDLLKAGFILMNKLSSEEIDFLIGFSDKKYSIEELKELRKLLLAKLSAEDVETLRGLADKYGKNLYILDPSVPIK